MTDQEWLFTKPLKNKELLSDFEYENKIQLPKDFKQFVEQLNGARPTISTFDTEHTKECVLNSLLSFNHEDLENVYKAMKVVQDNYLPIANDGFGNFIVYDKKSWKLYFLQHEDTKLDYISDSFTGLVKKLY